MSSMQGSSELSREAGSVSEIRSAAHKIFHELGGVDLEIGSLKIEAGNVCTLSDEELSGLLGEGGRVSIIPLL